MVVTQRHLKECSGADYPGGAASQACPSVFGIQVVVILSRRWGLKLEATNGCFETRGGPPAKVGWPVSHVMNLGSICKEAVIGSPFHPRKVPHATKPVTALDSGTVSSLSED